MPGAPALSFLSFALVICAFFEEGIKGRENKLLCLPLSRPEMFSAGWKTRLGLLEPVCIVESVMCPAF